MVKTLVKVDGMMCEMCEKHVSEAIKKAFEVKDVKASHSEGTAEILSENPLDEEKLRAAIDESGYKAEKITVREV